MTSKGFPLLIALLLIVAGLFSCSPAKRIQKHYTKMVDLIERHPGIADTLLEIQVDTVYSDRVDTLRSVEVITDTTKLDSLLRLYSSLERVPDHTPEIRAEIKKLRAMIGNVKRPAETEIQEQIQIQVNDTTYQMPIRAWAEYRDGELSVRLDVPEFRYTYPKKIQTVNVEALPPKWIKPLLFLMGGIILALIVVVWLLSNK